MLIYNSVTKIDDLSPTSRCLLAGDNIAEHCPEFLAIFFDDVCLEKSRVDVNFFVLFHSVVDRSRSEGFRRSFGNLVALFEMRKEFCEPRICTVEKG